MGRTNWVKDGAFNQTSFSYDGFSRVDNVIHPGSTCTAGTNGNGGGSQGGGSALGGPSNGGSGGPRKQCHAVLADEGASGVNPRPGDYSPPNPLTDNNGQTWEDEFWWWLLQDRIEGVADSTIPMDVFDCMLEIPWILLEKRRQQELEQYNDPYGDGDTMTLDNDAEYHKRPLIPRWFYR